MNKALLFLTIPLFLSCNTTGEIDDEIRGATAISLLKKAEKYIDKKHLSSNSYSEVHIFKNISINNYMENRCKNACIYEKKQCIQKLKNTTEYKKRLKQSKKVLRGQKDIYMKQYANRKCKASSLKEKCKEKLDIKSIFFSHIDKDKPVNILKYNNNNGFSSFAKKYAIIILDIETNNVIGFEQFGGLQ